MRKILISSLCLLVACERTALSPVEIKIDNEVGGFATENSLGNTYLVAQGETLFDIANKFNIDPMNLAKINNLKSPYNVRPGQVLKLPMEKEETSGEQDGQKNNLYAPVNLDQNSNQDTKELDDNFEKIMKADSIRSEVPGSDAAASAKSTKSESQAVAEKSASGQGFNEQAQSLSSPKVTSTATGAKISKETSKASNSSGKMVRPLDGKVISRFGDNLDGAPNDGINIKASAGTPVKAVSEGEVIYAGNNLDESFGNVVVIQHKNGVISSYAHLKDINVKKGAQITKGQKVGSVGKTGDVSSPQLHLEIMKNSTPENPEKYIGKI